MQRATCKLWTASCMLVTAPKDQTGPVPFPRNAGLAQLAEHRSCKADVAGSIPAPGSVPTRADFLLGCAEEEQAPGRPSSTKWGPNPTAAVILPGPTYAWLLALARSSLPKDLRPRTKNFSHERPRTAPGLPLPRR